MKAAVFAQLNSMPLKVCGYNQFKIGVYLRQEKSKRKYSNSFTFQKNLLSDFLIRTELRFAQGIEHEPKVDRMDGNASKNFLFEDIPHWADYFISLKPYLQEVRQLFYGLLTEQVKEELNKIPPPIIGVHIRMGDFRSVKSDQEFNTSGAVRTPIKYFIDSIQSIRSFIGHDLPVTVFSDGHEKELNDLLALSKVSLAAGKRDIVDLLLLSRSKIIITSAGSTFSYWAGFLSNAVLLHHPKKIPASIRSESFNRQYYEGPLFDTIEDNVLLKNLESIANDTEVP
ncbi:alpha-1,2-fucosyltransferase [Flavihumibacter profundi]|uniref:alpha-1,2-fucosyltransferase n=1 Tax=Flavihumibacter profundi TaxID=2716883 RepID=UPI001CC55FAA|nr:alpha-1,2-fucosyltransferase [Flavihumibacter profundi]MBZ5857999.1 alpha-1,2-fucosyltransferase [Flavihumibacter profundi]